MTRAKATATTSKAMVAAGLLLSSLTACSGGGGETALAERTVANAPAANASPVAATPQSGAPGPVVGVITREASLKANYPKIKDLFTAREVDVVVVGVIKEVQYRTLEDALAQTVLTVAVDKSRKGKVPATIEVWETGGYVRASEIAAENADKFPDSKAEAEEGWVEVKYERAEHPKVGQQVLLFLNKNRNPGFEGSFQEVGSVYGRFVLEGGDFVRTARGTEWEHKIARDAVDAQLAEPSKSGQPL